MKTPKFHRFSEAWRLLKGAEFDDLAADIKENGLREKIWLYEGQILDGRNRFLACQKAGVEPQFRTYKGSDPISFVISLNKHRRHDNESELAFAAARIATMRQGQRTDLASRDAKSQAEAATELGVSRSSLQRAKKVIEKGSKALQAAAESGEIPLKKAAAVVDLPKSEQLAAATSKTQPAALDQPERPEWEPSEDDALAAADRELLASAEKALSTDAFTEIKRLTAEVAALKISRDGFMNGKAEMTRLLKKEQAKNLRLIRDNEQLVRENHALKQRAA